MHIIIDGTTTQDQFAFAGVGQYTKHIILNLASQYPDTQYSVLLFEEKKSTLEPDINQYKNVKIERVGQYQLNDYKNDIYYFKQILPVIQKIRKPETIYYCPYFWRNYPANIMKTVLFVHDMNLPLFNMYSQQSSIHNYIRKIQYWLTLNKSLKCKYLIANSQTTVDDYLKYYPQYPKENISVTYLGADIEVQETDISNILPKDYSTRKYLIYLGGGINKTKNTEGVIKGYAEFVKTFNNINTAPYLVIAGKAFQDQTKPEVRELKNLISIFNLDDNVIFTGYYSDENKYSLLHNAFAFIHLAKYEGFGIAALEAIRSKVPTIVHESKIYKEIFNNMAIFVNGENPREVGEKISDVYNNPQKYTNQVEEAYNLSLKYDWKNTATQTHQVFEKIER